jgi:hypothetical protein
VNAPPISTPVKERDAWHALRGKFEMKQVSKFQGFNVSKLLGLMLPELILNPYQMGAPFLARSLREKWGFSRNEIPR